MEDCCKREKTVEEELRDLDIDEHIKERIIEKYERLVDEHTKQAECLYNCNVEINRLCNAIVSQAKTMSRLEENIMNIICNN